MDGGRAKQILGSVLAALFWVAVWQIAAMLVGQELLLPQPLSVVKALLRLAGDGAFWLALGMSLARVMTGLLTGILAGAALAVGMHKVPVLAFLFPPVLRLMRATPVASFIILLYLWIGRGRVPGFVAAVMVLPVVAESLRTALGEMDPLLLEMGRAYRFGFWKKVRFIVVPSVAATWESACMTATGLAWKAGIAAEAIIQPRSAIGTGIYNSRYTFDMAELFAWTAAAVMLSALVEWAIGFLLRGGGRGRRRSK